MTQRFTGLQMCTGVIRRKREQATATDTALPPDTRAIMRRSCSLPERRVTTCTVDLGGAWYTPVATRASATGMASDAERLRDPSFEEETGLAPLAKAQRPEEMPEAGSTLAPYRPPPVKADEVMGGTDEIGMASRN